MSNINNMFELMAKRGIKAAQITRDLGIGSGMISDWKKGRCVPSAKYLTMLAKYFDVDEAFILGYTDIEKTTAIDRTALENQIINDVGTLPPDKQAEVLNYVKYLVSQNLTADKPNLNGGTDKPE